MSDEKSAVELAREIVAWHTTGVAPQGEEWYGDYTTYHAPTIAQALLDSVEDRARYGDIMTSKLGTAEAQRDALRTALEALVRRLTQYEGECKRYCEITPGVDPRLPIPQWATELDAARKALAETTKGIDDGPGR